MLGLAGFGSGIAFFVKADIGVPPWDVFHQGISERTGLGLGTVLIIVGIKSVAAYYIVRSFGHDHDKGLTIAASLAQIGEFSFILITMGVKLAIVPTEARDLVVAGAMISILLNPLLFHLLDRRAARKVAAAPAQSEVPEGSTPEPSPQA